MNAKHFEKIYQNFVSVKDYNRSCFKILNNHYLIYLGLRERYYLKHRREEEFDEKKFDLIWLCSKNLEDTRKIYEQLISKFENQLFMSAEEVNTCTWG